MIATPNEKAISASTTPAQRSLTPTRRYAALSTLKPAGFDESVFAPAPTATALLSRAPGRLRTADLEVELARQSTELYTLRGELDRLNRLQRDFDLLRAQNERLVAQNRTLQEAVTAAEKSSAALSRELEQQRSATDRVEQSLRNTIDKASSLRVDSGGGIISADEMEARKAAQLTAHRASLLAQERDRLSVENFELRRAAGSAKVVEDLEDDVLRLRVKNDLQMAELEAAREKQRNSLLEDELRMVRRELAVLRESAPTDLRPYAELTDRQAKQLQQLKSDNQTLAAAVWKLRRDHQALLVGESELDGEVTLGKKLKALRRENKRLEEEVGRLQEVARAKVALKIEKETLQAQVESLQQRLSMEELPTEDQPRLTSLRENIVRKLKRLM